MSAIMWVGCAAWLVVYLVMAGMFFAVGELSDNAFDSPITSVLFAALWPLAVVGTVIGWLLSFPVRYGYRIAAKAYTDRASLSGREL